MNSPQMTFRLSMACVVIKYKLCDIYRIPRLGLKNEPCFDSEEKEHLDPPAEFDL